MVTTVAGSGTTGSADGVGTNAMFGTNTITIALDTAGTWYIGDYGNHRIRRMSSSGMQQLFVCECFFIMDLLFALGVVSTFAGAGSAVWLDGQGTAACFVNPEGIVRDSSGLLYVTDGSSRIRKVTTAGYYLTMHFSCYVYVCEVFFFFMLVFAGVVTTIAGSGANSYSDGVGTAAGLYNAVGLVFDSAGAIYATEYYNNRIRKLVVKCELNVLIVISLMS